MLPRLAFCRFTLLRATVTRIQLPLRAGHPSPSLLRKFSTSEGSVSSSNISTQTEKKKVVEGLVTPTDVASWSIEEVGKWAASVGFSTRNLKRLEENEITGDVLFDQTKEDFRSFGIPGGPATKLVKAIETLKTPTGSRRLYSEVKAVSVEPIHWEGEVEEDPHVTVASLPEGFNWIGLSSRHLFIRSFYDKVWQSIKKAYLMRSVHTGDAPIVERFLILGNSGIGKTVSLNYFLYQALKEGYPVLFETRSTRYFFNDNTVESESVHTGTKLEKHRNNKSVLLLHDHQPRKEPPLLFDGGAFTVGPVSPDPINFKEFRKHSCDQKWFKLTTRNELIAMNSVSPKLESSELESRINLFGPIPRLVFSILQSVALLELHTKIASFPINKAYMHMLRMAELPENKGGLSWWIVHVDARDDLMGAAKISWASDYVKTKVLATCKADDLGELESFLASYLSNPPLFGSLPSKEYERWVALSICVGTQLNIRTYKLVDDKVETNPAKPLLLPPCELSYVSNFGGLFDGIEVQSGVLYISKNPNEELVDCFMVIDKKLVLINMTMGGNHDIKQSIQNQWTTRAKALNLDEVIMIFIVPYQKAFKVDKAAFKRVWEKNLNNELKVSVGVSELQPRLQPRLQP